MIKPKRQWALALEQSEADLGLEQLVLRHEVRGEEGLGLLDVRLHADGSCSVTDNGGGIQADDLGKIFEPFYNTKATGVGIGLAISRSLVEAQGGKLWLDADTRPGACFHFTLPCAS